MSTPQVVDLLKRTQQDVDAAAIRAMRDASQLISTSRNLTLEIERIECAPNKRGHRS